MRTTKILVAMLVAVSLLVGATGTVMAGGQDGDKDKKDKVKKPDKPGDSDGKVTICHVPPGNPANAHTITVSENAVDAHLAHGDNLGPCECEK